MRLLILGATGGTGLLLVQQALDRGHEVTALARSPEKLSLRHERLGVVRGSPTSSSDLRRAVIDKDAVLSALGVRSRHAVGILPAAARATIDAMRLAGVTRLLVTSQALLYPDVGPLGPILRHFLAHHLRDSAAMEELVTASDLDWTVVRPARLTNGRGTGRYRVSEGHVPPGRSITRADTARAILDVTEQHTYSRRIIGLSK